MIFILHMAKPRALDIGVSCQQPRGVPWDATRPIPVVPAPSLLSGPNAGDAQKVPRGRNAQTVDS